MEARRRRGGSTELESLQSYILYESVPENKQWNWNWNWNLYKVTSYMRVSSCGGKTIQLLLI
ncbi:hypothetical protein E2320_013527 [Naja naja]|nr:hypothetical protein E2320_013527 [Naja naja]